jgi:hypothetical protein
MVLWDRERTAMLARDYGILDAPATNVDTLSLNFGSCLLEISKDHLDVQKNDAAWGRVLLDAR